MRIVNNRPFMRYIEQCKVKSSLEIYFIHQNDTRIFNRGAMKNLGFLYIKDKYPQSIILNDMPFDKALKTFRKEIG